MNRLDVVQDRAIIRLTKSTTLSARTTKSLLKRGCDKLEIHDVNGKRLVRLRKGPMYILVRERRPSRSAQETFLNVGLRILALMLLVMALIYYVYRSIK